MKKIDLVKYLFSNSNAIIRYRLACDFIQEKEQLDIGKIRADLLNHKEAKYWMKCLKTRRKYDNIHGSYDKSLENSLGKLIQFGIKKGISNFDKNVSSHLKWLKNDEEIEAEQIHNDYFLRIVVASLLAKAGYAQEPTVRDILTKRLKLVYDLTKKKKYDVFIEKSLFKSIPTAFKDHQMLDPEIYEDNQFALPWIYDLFAYEALYEDFKDEIDTIIEYILDERYQKFPDGYGVMVSFPKRFLIVGWDIWLPGYFDFDQTEFHLQNLLFRTNLIAPFEPTRKHPWFKKVLSFLEQFRTESGTYELPKFYLKEKRNSYYITSYHMGMGESRAAENAQELESTFWIANILRKAGKIKS